MIELTLYIITVILVIIGTFWLIKYISGGKGMNKLVQDLYKDVTFKNIFYQNKENKEQQKNDKIKK
jgi:methyl coenzyme M reductase alpha subunit